MTIRRASLGDAPAIADVHVKTWQDAYQGLFPDAFLANISLPERTDLWRHLLTDPGNHAVTFVCERDGELVGWCVVGPSRDEDASETVGELLAIYVIPTAQGQGVGRTLMAAGLQKLRDDRFTRATLWVLSGNIKSRAFYESLGWQPEDKTKIEMNKGGFEMHEIRYATSLSSPGE